MTLQDNGTETPTESPESRLKGAGFVNSMGFWREPNGERVFSRDDAIAKLDAGEIEPPRVAWPGCHPSIAHTFQTSDEEIDLMLGRNQPQPEGPPDWLIAQAKVIAAETVKQMKPVIRAEIRAELRKERERE